ncbi:hypothetical protein [Streptomyces sp. NPDC093261]|uniref:hypothetical protein n=1 Tax=Streptomyces sp. NPDC093261 TaxID=3366037 RepID=UPI00381C6E93
MSTPSILQPGLCPACQARLAWSDPVLRTRTGAIVCERHRDLFIPDALADKGTYEEVWERRDLQPYTVTIAGSERHDGEAPYTYVVNAPSGDAAWEYVARHHVEEEQDLDVERVSVELGVPGDGSGYHWNDLREQ